MEIWIRVALVGGLLSLLAMFYLVRDYRRGLLTGLELGIMGGTYLLIVGAVIVTEVIWSRPAGVLFLIIMMPFWFGIRNRAKQRQLR